MENLSSILDLLVDFARSSNLVNGVIVLGSVARGTATPRSDLDVAYVLNPSAESSADRKSYEDSYDRIRDELLRHLGDTITFHCVLQTPPKLAMYVGVELAKVDLFLVRDVVEIASYLPPDLNPALTLRLDKSGGLLRALEVCCGRSLPSGDNPTVQTPVATRINEEIDKLLYGFESASSFHFRSDGYRFYFEYNLALQRLVRVICLVRGFSEELYLPSDFTFRVLTEAERPIFRDLAAVLSLSEANVLKRRFLDFFYPIFAEAAQKFPLQHSLTSIQTFCETIFNRDFFWNFRDFAQANPDGIREGILYRSAALARYVGTPQLERWVQHYNLHTIIDLRDRNEVETMSYPRDFLRQYNIDLIAVPVHQILPDTTESVLLAEFPLAKYYLGFLQHCCHIIRTVFETIASTAPGAIVIHCHAGKDRTGIIISLLHLLLNTPSDRIIDDYLLSGLDASLEKIHAVFKYIEMKGGSVLFFKDIGIQSEIHSLLKQKFSR